MIPTLRRTVAELHHRFPKARIQIRMDAGFYHPLVIDILEEIKVVYAVGMGKNPVLQELAQNWMTISRTLPERHGEKQMFFGSADYKTGLVEP